MYIKSDVVLNLRKKSLTFRTIRLKFYLIAYFDYSICAIQFIFFCILITEIFILERLCLAHFHCQNDQIKDETSPENPNILICFYDPPTVLPAIAQSIYDSAPADIIFQPLTAMTLVTPKIKFYYFLSYLRKAYRNARKFLYL